MKGTGDAMENRTKPSPSPHPLLRGEGERANASSTFGECWLRSHASKLGAKAARLLHDRTPWRTQSFQPSRVVLPLPWGEGWGEGEGLDLSLTAFFLAVGSGLHSPKIARNLKR